MKGLLREPFVHFVVLGAAVFGLWSAVSGGTGEAAPGEIVVTEARIASLAAGFARTWRRPPTTDELSALIREHVREEICAREAKALALDDDDVIVRRRLRQKLEFVSEGLAAAEEPTDADLSAWLAQHADRYRLGREVSFRHVFLNPERRGERVATDAAALLASLRAGADPDAADAPDAGDPFLLGTDFRSMPERDVDAQFGGEFAEGLVSVAPGRWEGPLRSSFGEHLVLVTDRTEGRPAELAEVRLAVLRDWEADRRHTARERFYEALQRRYVVRFESPAAAADGAAAGPAR